MRLIFVTGGAGYVGSHCVLELLTNNYEVIVADNCCNCTKLDGSQIPESLVSVQRLANKQITKYVNFDINDEEVLNQIFATNSIDVVMHFAALKSVAESVANPLEYYRNNVSGTVKLLQVMNKYNVKKFIFSSSATVYGDPKYLPIDESHPTGQSCTNPYGKSKFMVEEILQDLCTSDNEWSVISLRYFNPVGAHSSGDIGEDPQNIPNNLMPILSQVAVGVRKVLKVFGSDYDTPDGTGVRDYIHIEDLANGHFAALNKMLTEKWEGFNAINLGTGRGYSVLEVVSAFKLQSNVAIPYELEDRRVGDVASLYADAKLAKKVLNWKAKRSLNEMCSAAWKWQSKNPKGYKTGISDKNGSAVSDVNGGGHKTNGNEVNGTSSRVNGVNGSALEVNGVNHKNGQI